MTKPRIIGLCGLIGSGKSTFAKRLVQAHGYKLIRFAEPLKAMAKCIGLTHEQIDGNEKELPCALLGNKTPRQFMQMLGTDFGRKMINDSLWTDVWASTVHKYRGYIVVDDIRFENEYQIVKNASPDSAVFRIYGPNAETELSCVHESELFALQAPASYFCEEIYNNKKDLSSYHDIIDTTMWTYS